MLLLTMQVAFGPQGGLQPMAPVELPLELPPVVPPLEVMPPEPVPLDAAVPVVVAPPDVAPLEVPVLEAPTEELVPPLEPAQPTAARTRRIAATLIEHLCPAGVAASGLGSARIILRTRLGRHPIA